MKWGVFLLTLIAMPIFAQEISKGSAEEKIEYREAFKGPAPFRDYTLEEKLAHYMMDDQYRSGFFLIYDCKKKIYTCVDEPSFNACKDRREKDKFMQEKSYSCAPLKKFPDREKCLLVNYEVMQQAAFERFCYPDN